MSGPTRRTFLKQAVGAVPGAAIAGSLAVGACSPDETDQVSEGARPAYRLPPDTLRAVAEVTLPTGALGSDGTESAVLEFEAWVEEFESAAELDHPYLTGDLRYGPPHPGPRWAAQLDAMDRESEQRSGVRFAGLSPEQRRAIVEDAIRSERSASLPRSPALADGVAAGLLAWFYATSRANDLCYQAEVGRHLCRGTASLPEEPAPLGDE